MVSRVRIAAMAPSLPAPRAAGISTRAAAEKRGTLQGLAGKSLDQAVRGNGPAAPPEAAAVFAGSSGGDSMGKTGQGSPSIGNGSNRPRLPGRPAGEYQETGKTGGGHTSVGQRPKGGPGPGSGAAGRASMGDGSNRPRISNEPPLLRMPGSRD